MAMERGVKGFNARKATLLRLMPAMGCRKRLTGLGAAPRNPALLKDSDDESP
jgi:hypothetical protein